MTYQPPEGTRQDQYPAYAAPYDPRTQPKGKSVASLVIGIVSLVLGFTFIVPIVGVILGAVGMSSEPAGRGMAIAGVILNLIALAGWIIFVIIFGLALVAFWAASAGVMLPLL
jgi:hypothetical protein